MVDPPDRMDHQDPRGFLLRTFSIESDKLRLASQWLTRTAKQIEET
jgi:hypothetical protein